MADTFSNDLRLRLQESGSNAGTWGDLLNGTITNIASGFGQGSEAIPNASTHTITLADGTADEARSLYLKCTGGGQACTVTLGPNTISKVWIIDNATSYTLTFSQGSGANVAIAAGAVKVIATDGAGSGAAVVDTLDGLEGSLSTLAVTGAVTADGLTVDGAATIDGGATDNTVLTLDSGTANTYLKITDSNSTNGTFIGATTNDLNFYPNNSLAVTMTASGSVGIGTSSPRTLVNASSATGAILTLESSDTSLTTNGVIGGIDFYSNDSSTNGTGAKVNIRAIGQNSSGTATALTFGTSSSGSATAVEAMRIDASGNVGIGTSSPSAKLQISQNSNGAYVTSSIVNTNAGGYSNLTLTAGSATSGIYYAPGIFFAVGPASGDTTTPIVFRNNNATERMRIDASGNLLVGHTGQLSASKFLVSFDGTSHNAFVARTTRTSINSNFAVFLNSSNQVAGSITHNGSTTVNYSASSDQRLKENIADSDDSGNVIDAIQVRKFDWITGGEHEKYGFIAQELKTVVPNAVSTMGMPDEEDPMLGVDPSKLMALAIKEIQSLRSRVAELENN